MCGDKPRWSKLAKDVKLIRVQANSISQLHISIHTSPTPPAYIKRQPAPAGGEAYIRSTPIRCTCNTRL